MARRDLTQGSISQHFIKLTLPMILGILGMVAFNLADTYYLGKLGTLEMAALTFTFPVVLLISSLNMGLGIGTSALISKVYGEKDYVQVKELSSYSLLLSFTFSLIACTIGLLTIEPVFELLGSDATVMPYIKEYMSIWYLGVPFVVIPMVGNSIIRSLGDTKIPSLIMLISALTNIILDPIFIFGFGPIPSLGVEGAAIATVFSRSITFLAAIYVLTIREKAISFKLIRLNKILYTWKKILYMALPNAIARMILPIGFGVITSLISVYGIDAIAGYGIATRIEYFALAITQALSSVIPVFVGQNFGAKAFDRIKSGIAITTRFMIYFNAFVYVMLFLFAPFMASIFTKNPLVQDTVVLYMRIVPIGYGLQGMILVMNGTLNALHRPVLAASLNLTQMLIIYVPLALVLSPIMGIKSIFGTLVFSYLIVAIIGQITVKKILKMQDVTL